MKTCSTCGSVTFDDMEMCFDCMSSFAVPIESEDLANLHTAVRLQVTLADYFCYELLLQKLEGRSLSVGSAAENAIIIPQEQVASRQLEVFYAHGHIWAESVDAAAQTTVGHIPLCGTVRLQPGIEISVGSATIKVLE